jgi:hypothetical protein
MEQENREFDDDLAPDAREALESGEFSLDAIDQEAHDDDYESYGKKVKKRIDKEVSKRKALADRLAETETNAQRIARELKEAKDKLNQYEERESEGLDTRAKDLQARRDAALEAGEMAEYNKLNDELTDVRFDLRERRRRPPVETKIEVEQEPPPKTNTSGLSKAAAAWVEDNEDWLGEDQEKAANAAKIERQLINEGYLVTDPDLYAELDRRLSGYGREEEIDDTDDIVEPPRRGASAGVPRNSGNQRPSSRPGALTRTDLQKMRNAGFDPDNPADRKGWLDRNKPL